MGKWLRFVKNDEYSGKTDLWLIVHVDTDEVLGLIKWQNGWRQYVSYPVDGSFWSKSCHREVADKIEELMEARKE